MTRSPSRNPSDARRPSSRPTVNVDPVRVLREHWKAIAGGGAIGAVLGTILNFGMGAAYPIFSGEAVFEIRNRIIEGTDAVGQDYSQEEQVVRIANTEIGVTPHAGTHASTGNDPVSPSSIGALSVGEGIAYAIALG